MTTAQFRDFDKVAANWDEKPQRRLLASAVAQGIAAAVPLHHTMRALEYGCGTGLVGLQLATEIGRLTAADASRGMLQELGKKSQELGLANVTPLLVPHEGWTLPAHDFDLVFASMVLHHISDVATLLRNFQQTLAPGGFLALADLDQEDGFFHDDVEGVAHHGFDRQELMDLLGQSGFTAMEARTVHTLRKERASGPQDYPVFLITARKPR